MNLEKVLVFWQKDCESASRAPVYSACVNVKPTNLEAVFVSEGKESESTLARRERRSGLFVRMR